MTRDIRLTLIGKPGCHLCDDAREVVRAVMAEVEATDAAPRLALDERSILDDAALAARYAEEIRCSSSTAKCTTTGASTRCG